jgi:hypothetical protein
MSRADVGALLIFGGLAAIGTWAAVDQLRPIALYLRSAVVVSRATRLAGPSGMEAIVDDPTDMPLCDCLECRTTDVARTVRELGNTQELINRMGHNDRYFRLLDRWTKKALRPIN